MAAAVNLSPAQRSQRARAAAFAKHAQHDPRESTARAREAWMERFYETVDPSLPQPERDRRARAAMRSYMASLALRSSKARAR